MEDLILKSLGSFNRSIIHFWVKTPNLANKNKEVVGVALRYDTWNVARQIVSASPIV
jgi:hypothetical protein